MKKFILSIIILFFVILFLAGAGFFYWQQSQNDVRDLNKTLPEGVKVVKSLISNEYKVVNKIDNYEFKIPPEWQGIKEIAYVPEREEEGYIGTSLNLQGQESFGRVIGIDKFKSGGDMGADLESWAKTEFNTFSLIGDFSKDEIGEFDIIKTQENIHFGGEYVYFFKKQAVYSITGPSEKFIRYIINNGKW